MISARCLCRSSNFISVVADLVAAILLLDEDTTLELKTLVWGINKLNLK